MQGDGLASSFVRLPWLTFSTFSILCTPPPTRIYDAETTLMMSLPVIRTVVDAADFSKTVLPYVAQLNDLPQQILQSISNPQALKVLYVSTNPLISAFAFSLFLFPIFLVGGEINKNYSQVDRFWSILPTLYNAHYVLYAHAVGLPTQRLDTLLAFSCVWTVSTSLLMSSFDAKSPSCV